MLKNNVQTHTFARRPRPGTFENRQAPAFSNISFLLQSLNIDVSYKSYELKGLKQWNEDDVKEWIKSFKFEKKFEENLIKICKTLKINGEILLYYKKSEDVKEEWEINTFESVIIFDAIKEAKESFRCFDDKKVKIANSIEAKDVILHSNGPPLALMNCGHAIGASSLYNYMKSEFMKPSVVDIFCPSPNCKEKKIKWDWNLCNLVANLSIKELEYFENLRVNRQKSLKKCPSCHNFTSAPENSNYLKVNCGSSLNCCDFCWTCNLTWKTISSSICGNDACDKTYLNNILTQANKTIDKYLTKFPAIRACPNCETIIEHAKGCKHMECPVCKKSFCFRCLSTKSGNTWPCGDAYDNCEVAPIQVLGSKKKVNRISFSY